MSDRRRGSRRPEQAAPADEKPDRPARREQAAPADEKPDRPAAPAGLPGRLAALDDRDTPLYSVGQAADALGTRPAALRRLDAAGVVTPGRSTGGQRRYSRRQLERAGRIQAYVADGTSAALAGHIVDLEDEVADLREQLRQARREAGAGGTRQGSGRGASGAARGRGPLPGPRASSD